MRRHYVIKSHRRDQYYTGDAWSGFFSDAARWTTLRAASKVCNRLIEQCHVVVLVSTHPPHEGSK